MEQSPLVLRDQPPCNDQVGPVTAAVHRATARSIRRTERRPFRSAARSAHAGAGTDVNHRAIAPWSSIRLPDMAVVLPSGVVRRLTGCRMERRSPKRFGTSCPVSLSRIAVALGLSVTTVSRALGGFSDVSAATRARVEAEAARIGYRPNRAARMLRSGRSGAVAMVLPAAPGTVRRPVLPAYADGRRRRAGADRRSTSW